MDYLNRVKRINSLKKHLEIRESELLSALEQDLGKSSFEGYASELGILHTEIDHVLKSLKKWMRPKRVKGNWLLYPSKSYIQYRPRGEVLIISPWNYPVQLCFMPLIGALAAGNRAVLKPSELAPTVAEAIDRLIKDAFPDGWVRTELGGKDKTEALIEARPDLIFFTGSTAVGSLIMQQAARHLIPVILELGGKSPCLLYKAKSLEVAVRRIVWGKFLNSGQTCVAPDFLLVHRDERPQIIEVMKRTLEDFYGANPLGSQDWGKVISPRHFERLLRFIDKNEVILGGQRDQLQQKIAPTVIEAQLTDSVMQEEIFGPILPMITFESEEEAFSIIAKYREPLAAYLFSEDQVIQNRFVSEVQSGGLCLNDCVLQLTNHHLPFGGVGPSGMGQYHGHHSFLAFSHQQAVLKRTFWFDLKLRYPPYRKISLQGLKKILGWLS